MKAILMYQYIKMQAKKTRRKELILHDEGTLLPGSVSTAASPIALARPIRPNFTASIIAGPVSCKASARPKLSARNLPRSARGASATTASSSDKLKKSWLRRWRRPRGMKGINEPLILSHCAKVTYTIETYINELRNVGFMLKSSNKHALSRRAVRPVRCSRCGEGGAGECLAEK